MTIRARRITDDVPVGSIIVRIVRAGDQIAGFVRDVEEPGGTDTVHSTEQKPIDHVWRLVENKLSASPGATVYVEMEPGIEWRPEWGSLEG